MIRLSSEDVPVADRFIWWADQMAQSLVPTWFSSSEAHDFRASAAMLELGPETASILEFPALRSVRTRRLIQRFDPEWYELVLVLGGSMHLEQERNEVFLSLGDLVLYDTSHPFDARQHERSGRLVIVNLPHSALPIPDRAVRNLLARPLPSRTGQGALLAQFLAGLAEQAPTLRPPATEQMSTVVTGLATAFIADLADTDVPPPARPQALLYEIKMFIMRHLTEPLSPALIAAAHHISVRYVHHLFRHEEQTVGEFIRNRRLERCRADLSDPRLRDRSVAEVGFRWGFTDAAVFNRTFKEATGLAPGAYRRNALKAGDSTL